jgi:hypothetical protein
MRIFLIVFSCFLMSITYAGFAQHYSHFSNNTNDTKDYSPPSFPGGYDSLVLYLEKNIMITDTNSVSYYNTVLDAIITFTVTDSGNITNIKHKGANVNGLADAIKQCFTSMPIWVPGKKKNKNVTSEVQLTFTYTIDSNGMKIINKNPLYIYNYEQKEKKTEKYIIAVSILALCLYFVSVLK